MGTNSRRRNNRKKRRSSTKVLKFGRGAAPRHRSKSGRTGTAHSKKMKTLQPERD